MTDKIEWSGKTSSYHHKWNDTPNPEGENEGLRKVWFLDAQWSTCPVEVEDEVKELWKDYELGNDHYMIKRSANDLVEDYPAITQYIREHGIPDNEDVVIHWWW